MTQLKKFAWYGSSVAFAALLAVTLLVTASQSAFATATLASASISVGGNTTLTATDADLVDDALAFITVEIIGGTGVAEIHAAGGDKQSIVCIDGAACDTDADPSEIGLRINGVGEGSVIIRTTLNGDDDDAPVTLNRTLDVTSAPSAFEVETSAAAIAATGGNATITATLLDGNGAPVVGRTVSFVTSLGTLTGGAQVATDPTDGLGEAAVTLSGGGVSGVATVTASATGGFSGSVQVTFSGAAANITAAPVKSYIQRSAGGATFNVTDLTVTVTDSAGNPVSAATVSFDEQTPTAAANGVVVDDTADGTAATVIPDCTAGTNATGKCNASVTAGATTALGAHTLVFELDSDTTKKATTTVNVSGAAASVAVDAPGAEPVTVSSIQVTVTDADGNPVANGTSVLLVVTAGALASNNATTTNGVATFTYVSPGTAQSVNATAIVGAISGSDTFNVGTGAGETPGDGSFTGTIADSGVSIVSFDGGSVADLGAAASDAGLVSVWVTVDGEFVGYIVGAPAFVNAAFNAAFPDGLDEGTLAIVVK